MMTFSRRYGYNQKEIQLEYASDTLKQRIFLTFYEEEFDDNVLIDLDISPTAIKKIMKKMGVSYIYPKKTNTKQKNAYKLQKFIIDSPWYTIFDFIEQYLTISDEETAKKMTKEFNCILEEEVSAYRIIDNLVVPITNKSELETIDEAINSPYDSVKTHISKALSLYSDRKKPDYENSIKESISSVEAMCCIITGLEGNKATLGNTIKHLKDNGVDIHDAMVKAFLSLYGYTSDEDGIRHGSADFKNAPSEDAKYMLVSCSAFVNYLIEKWRKVNS